MRIGIDGRELCGHPTGVGRYLTGLLNAWAADEHARTHEFVLYAPEPLAVPDGRQQFVSRIVAGPAGTWWEQVKLPAAVKRDRLDVFFAPAYSTALSHAVPTVLALHDLSFFAHPEWFTTKEGLRRRWFARESAASAAAVITISEFSRRELRDHLNLPDERIHVVPPGITLPALPPSHGLPGRSVPPRVLYVGSVFNRRHLPDLLQAFAPIARVQPSARLSVVGDNRTYPHIDLGREIRREGLEAQVEWKAYVSDDELGQLYADAGAFAFLSEYEGLGLTPLEALASGVPPLLLDTPVARESCGPSALYVARHDIKGATSALESILFDRTVRAALLATAGPTLARFDWHRAGRDTLAVLEASA